MGGHGGLNILPQKKWNVYNYDNRAIVNRDKKAAAAKKKAEFQKNRSDKFSQKLDALAYRNKSPQKSEPTQQKPNLTVPQLPDKPINLFEKEEKILKSGEPKNNIKKTYINEFGIQDEGIKFQSTNAPWYAQKKGEYKSQKKEKYSRSFQSVEAKKTDSVAISELAEIQSKKNEEMRNNRQRSREKNHHKRQEGQETQNKSQIEILREKRLKRERKEREKALRLMNH